MAVKQAPPTGPRRPAPPAGGPARVAKPFWRRPWIVPLMLGVAGYLWYQVHPFIPLREATSPMPPHQGFSLYYPILLVHIAAGTTAMVTVCFQVWPWLRRNHPAVHRAMGRIYVLATVAGGVCGLTILRFAPPVGQIGAAFVTLLWMGFTLNGYRLVRAGRYAEHRRFMIYSFAIVINNWWGVAFFNLITYTHWTVPVTYILEFARWAWVINLLIAEWWIHRTARRPVDLPPRMKGRTGAAAVMAGPVGAPR